MDKTLYYTIEEKDIKEFGGKSELILKHRIGLHSREISRLKFMPEGITVRKSGTDIQSRVTTADCLTVGDVLAVRMSDHEETQIIPQKYQLNVLYEDEDLFIIDKPAGTAVHPSNGHYTDTMANYAASWFRDRGEKFTCRVIGRLDKDTSGVLVYAKNRMTAARLNGSGRPDRRTFFRREYYALVSGSFSVKSGSYNDPIGPCDGNPGRQEVRKDGRAADTYYEVMGERSEKDGVVSLVWIHIGTGRTHQIRVHMAYAGHPLLGDAVYGDGGSVHVYGRTMLHSYGVTLIQPFTGDTIHVSSSFPVDFCRAAAGIPVQESLMK